MRLNGFVIIETKEIEYFTNFRFDFATQLYTQWLGTDEKDTKKLWQSILYLKTYSQKVLGIQQYVQIISTVNIPEVLRNNFDTTRFGGEV